MAIANQAANFFTALSPVVRCFRNGLFCRATLYSNSCSSIRASMRYSRATLFVPCPPRCIPGNGFSLLGLGLGTSCQAARRERRLERQRSYEEGDLRSGAAGGVWGERTGTKCTG